MKKDYYKLIVCLCCGRDNFLLPVLDLGPQVPANSYKKDINEIQQKYPLGIQFCSHCNHLQLTHIVFPDILFKDYSYVSGTSKTGLNHFIEIAKKANNFCEEYNLPKVVLDIGCNDGTQLDCFKELGFETYGVDPAENLYDISTKKGHNIKCGYFGISSLGLFLNKNISVIIAQNVFAHTDNPFNFLYNINEIFKSNKDRQGISFIQTSQANMIKNNEFDTIYHEHCSYFNEYSMNNLVEMAGLKISNIDYYDIHGGSFLFSLVTPDFYNHLKKHNYVFFEKLFNLQLTEIDTYDNYKKNILKIKEELVKLLLDLKSNNFKIIGYGAAAKGMTLINYTKIPLDYIIDDNPLKQNKFTPGSNIPIYSINKLKELDPNEKIIFIPLAWNFYDEIYKRIKEVRNNVHDKFVRYFPEVRIN